jgi:predicted dinucleotide-binding enzyme
MTRPRSDVVKHLGDALNGKVVVDLTNALDANLNWAVGYSTSGAEELQGFREREL